MRGEGGRECCTRAISGVYDAALGVLLALGAVRLEAAGDGVEPPPLEGLAEDESLCGADALFLSCTGKRITRTRHTVVVLLPLVGGRALGQRGRGSLSQAQTII